MKKKLFLIITLLLIANCGINAQTYIPTLFINIKNEVLWNGF